MLGYSGEKINSKAVSYRLSLGTLRTKKIIKDRLIDHYATHLKRHFGKLRPEMDLIQRLPVPYLHGDADTGRSAILLLRLIRVVTSGSTSDVHNVKPNSISPNFIKVTYFNYLQLT
jgi:hypothetical protein